MKGIGWQCSESTYRGSMTPADAASIRGGAAMAFGIRVKRSVRSLPLGE